MTRIKLLMEEERLYLNPRLKPTNVAEALDVNYNAVSACINAQGNTFNKLVNDYRLQHAKEERGQTNSSPFFLTYDTQDYNL